MTKENSPFSKEELRELHRCLGTIRRHRSTTIPHNRLQLSEADPIETFSALKKTLAPYEGALRKLVEGKVLEEGEIKELKDPEALLEACGVLNGILLEQTKERAEAAEGEEEATKISGASHGARGGVAAISQAIQDAKRIIGNRLDGPGQQAEKNSCRTVT